ncbi:hypothetical protein YC2023_008401 [Brassica napus]
MSCKARRRQKLKHIPSLPLLSPSPWKLKTSEKKNLCQEFVLPWMRSGCCVSGRRGDELMSVDMLLLDTNVSSVLEFSGGLEDFLFRIFDIIGEITAVKSSVSDPPADNNHLMATIKLEK